MIEALRIKFIISDWCVRGKVNALITSVMNIQRPHLATEFSSWLWYPFTAEVKMIKPSCLTDCDAWPHYLMSPIDSHIISGCSHLQYLIAPASNSGYKCPNEASFQMLAALACPILDNTQDNMATGTHLWWEKEGAKSVEMLLMLNNWSRVIASMQCIKCLRNCLKW